MKNKSYTALLIGTLALSVLFTGCGSSSSGEKKDSNPSYYATSEEISEVQGDLGDSITSCKFYLDGKIYQFPLNVSELISDGWTFDEEAVKNVSSLQPGAITNATYLNKEMESYTEKMGVTFCNNTDQTVALEEAPINSLDISKICKSKAILPKGMTWESTLEDVIAAYGDADETTSFENRTSLSYSAEIEGESISITLQFDKNDEGADMLTVVQYRQ